MPALVVLNEDAVPKHLLGAGRAAAAGARSWPTTLKAGAEVAGAALSNPEPVLSVRTR